MPFGFHNLFQQFKSTEQLSTVTTEHLEIHFLNVFLIVIFLFAHPETSLSLKQVTIRGNSESSQKTPCIYHTINLPVKNPGDCSKLLNRCRQTGNMGNRLA